MDNKIREALVNEIRKYVQPGDMPAVIFLIDLNLIPEIEARNFLIRQEYPKLSQQIGCAFARETLSRKFKITTRQIQTIIAIRK